MNETRNKILIAASDLFLKGGVAALSVRAIATKAGLSTIGIYSHFKGKQGVLDALYIEGFEFVYQAMHVQQSDAKDDFSDLETVLNACAAYMDVGVEHEAHYRLIFGERDASYMPSEEAQAAAKRAFAKLVLVAGEFLRGKSSKEAQQLALNIWAVMHGYVSIGHHIRMTNQEIDWKQQALNAIERQLTTTR